MKIWNLKRHHEAKNQPPRIEISNPKRYDEHPYHFTIQEPPGVSHILKTINQTDNGILQGK